MLLGLLILYSLMGTTFGLLPSKFKTLVCDDVDKNHGIFKLCKITAINRFKNLINIQYLQKMYADNMQIQIELYKRANGWHPFLYNFKFDGCTFMKKQNNLIASMAFNYLKSFTNFNHTCPYKANELFKVENLGFDIAKVRNRFPIDVGEYALHLSFFKQSNHLTMTINGSLEYANYRD